MCVQPCTYMMYQFIVHRPFWHTSLFKVRLSVHGTVFIAFVKLDAHQQAGFADTTRAPKKHNSTAAPYRLPRNTPKACKLAMPFRICFQEIQHTEQREELDITNHELKDGDEECRAGSWDVDVVDKSDMYTFHHGKTSGASVANGRRQAQRYSASVDKYIETTAITAE